MAFLARFVGALAPSAVEGTSRDVGERGRVFVEGVSDEVERLLVDCFGPGSDRLEVDGSDSGMRERVARIERRRGQQKCTMQEIGGLMGSREGSIRKSKRLTWALPPSAKRTLTGSSHNGNFGFTTTWLGSCSHKHFPSLLAFHPFGSIYPSHSLYHSISTRINTRPQSRPAYSTKFMPPVQILSLC